MKHPGYNDAKRMAGALAMANPEKQALLYFDGRAVFVRLSDVAAPPDSTLICVAQKWDDKVVKFTYLDGREEWVKP